MSAGGHGEGGCPRGQNEQIRRQGVHRVSVCTCVRHAASPQTGRAPEWLQSSRPGMYSNGRKPQEEGGLAPPPPPFPMFEADSQNVASAPLASRRFKLQKFWPAFGGDHGPQKEGGSQPTPPPSPLQTPPPPLLMPWAPASSAMLEPRVLPLKHAALHPTYGPTNTQLCSLVSSHVIQRLSTSPFPLQQENRKPYG